VAEQSGYDKRGTKSLKEADLHGGAAGGRLSSERAGEGGPNARGGKCATGPDCVLSRKPT